MDINKVTIRPVEDKDLTKIGNVVMAAKLPQLVDENLTESEVKEICQRYSAENLKTKVTDNFYFVAEISDEKMIVGVIGLRKDDGNDIHNRLSMFFIDPKYQGKGIGRFLYEKVKEKAMKQGCERLVVSSSPFAEPIYAHLGFKKVRVDWKEHANGRKSYNVWMEQDLVPTLN